MQLDVYDKLRADVTTVETMTRLAGKLSEAVFLTGTGNRLGVVDVIVAAGLYDLLSLVFPPATVAADAPFAAVTRWFATVTAEPTFADVLVRFGKATGGAVRVGGQVDLRAVPAHVAALADASIARNVGHKKAASQRDVEKAAKGDEGAAATVAAAAAGGGGASSAPRDEPATPAATSHAVAGAGVPRTGTATAAQPAANKTLPGRSVDDRVALTAAKLGELGITYTEHRHAAAMTVDDMLRALGGLPGTKCKNLFVKAKKEKAAGDSRMWLVIAAHDSDTNLVALATKLGYGKIVIRFGEADALLDNLGVVQGNVSPFALANDTALAVNVAIDARLLDPTAGPLYFHPLTNEASFAITPDALTKFVTATGHGYEIVDFSAKA